MTLNLGNSCICNDFVDSAGYGNCKKPHAAFLNYHRQGFSGQKGFAMMCYVDLPANCPDLKVIGQNTGYKYGRSAEACKKG